MSGMWGKRSLIDIALGYSDEPNHSSETERGVYFFHFSSYKAQLGMTLQLRGTRPIIRPPANEGENVVAKIVETTLRRMTTMEKKK